MTHTSHNLWIALIGWLRSPHVRDAFDRAHAETIRAIGALITFALVVALVWAMGTLTHVWLLGP